MEKFDGQSPQPDGSELAAKLVSLFSISLLSMLFGIKTFNVHYRYLTYSRWLILLLYIFSWTFTTVSMLLVTTNNRNYTSCFLSIMVCDIFYAGTKIAIYAWLIEKIYVVSSIRTTRWKSKAYRFHVCLMLPYIGICALMLIFHISEIEESGMCIIGLQAAASLPLLIYDFLINLYMTIFFIRPLLKLSSNGVKRVTDWKASRLNEVALRTLVASVVCLVASFANIFSLVMFNGRERGLVCLTCCTVDVIINVVTIHWVTSHSPGKRVKDNTNVEGSSQHRESNPEISGHLQKSYIHNGDQIDADVLASNQLGQEHSFTKSNFQVREFQFVPPYSANPNVTSKIHHETLKDEKCDDQASTDSNFFTSSIHESHSSRKSLTKKQ